MKEKEILAKLIDYGNENGFQVMYYLDYREAELDEKTIERICCSADPQAELNDLFMEWEGEISQPTHFQHLWEELELEGDKWDLYHLTCEAGFYASLDVNFILEQNNMPLVIVVKNLDIYTWEDWIFDEDNRYPVDLTEEAEEVIRLLGGKPEEFLGYVKQMFGEDDYQKQPLYHSLYREWHNLFYDYAKLVFLHYPTIKEFLALKKAKAITIHPETTCGFVNFYNGAGSTLGINLPQPLTLQAEQYDLDCDGVYHYPVQTIYHLHSNTWEGKVETADDGRKES